MIDLEFPKIDPTDEKINGIFQSDIVLQTGLELAFKDMREKPWMLEYALQGLLVDQYTKDRFGAKTKDKAKEWFLDTKIPVIMDYWMSSPPAYFLSISLLDSSEAEHVLGDVDPDVQEDVWSSYRPLTSRFIFDYDPATGIGEIQGDIDVEPSTAMGIVDSSGGFHPILEITPDGPRIEEDLVADFNFCVLAPIDSKYTLSIEGVYMHETYRIGCHVKGEPEKLLWLHTYTQFALLTYKEDLLESRGFGRSKINSSPMQRNNMFGDGENIWQRFITISGYSRYTWPKNQRWRILNCDDDITYL